MSVQYPTVLQFNLEDGEVLEVETSAPIFRPGIPIGCIYSEIMNPDTEETKQDQIIEPDHKLLIDSNWKIRDIRWVLDLRNHEFIQHVILVNVP